MAHFIHVLMLLLFVCVGKNALGNIMANISSTADLSGTYTNHSIRATCITAFDRAGIAGRHICRISGHKSEESIWSYSDRLSEEKSRQISSSIASFATSAASALKSTPDCNDVENLVPDGELLQLLLAPFDDENVAPAHQKPDPCSVPMIPLNLNNCQNITINFYK